MVNISAETVTPLFQEHLQQGGRAGGEEEGGGRGRGGVAGWGGRGGGHKDNFPSSPPLRSITQRWSLHRAGRLATWHPSSQPSPGNQTCDRNQPATSHLPAPPPPPLPPPLFPLLSLLLFAPSVLHPPPLYRCKCTYAETHL